MSCNVNPYHMAASRKNKNLNARYGGAVGNGVVSLVPSRPYWLTREKQQDVITKGRGGMAAIQKVSRRRTPSGFSFRWPS